jgi:hypothetical protein
VYLVPDPSDDDKLKLLATQTPPETGPSGVAYRYIGWMYFMSNSTWLACDYIGGRYWPRDTRDRHIFKGNASNNGDAWRYIGDMRTKDYNWKTNQVCSMEYSHSGDGGFVEYGSVYVYCANSSPGWTPNSSTMGFTRWGHWSYQGTYEGAGLIPMHDETYGLYIYIMHDTYGENSATHGMIGWTDRWRLQ